MLKYLTNKLQRVSTYIFSAHASFIGVFPFWFGVLGKGFSLTFFDVSLQSTAMYVCEGMSKGQPLVCIDKIYCFAYDTLGAMLFLKLYQRCYFLSSSLGLRPVVLLLYCHNFSNITSKLLKRCLLDDCHKGVIVLDSECM